MLVRNQKRARVSLLQRPEFRDTKLILAMKYEELDRLRNIIRAKQEQLGELFSCLAKLSCDVLVLASLTPPNTENVVLFCSRKIQLSSCSAVSAEEERSCGRGV